MRRVPQEAFLSTECQFRTVEGGFWYGALPKTHRTWLSGAQESGWQLPLRGLSTPGRGRGRLPPQRSLAHKGRLPPQRSRLPYLRRDNQVINLIEVRSFRGASENASHLVVRSTGKRVAVASERPVYPRTEQWKGSPELPIDFFAIFA